MDKRILVGGGLLALGALFLSSSKPSATPGRKMNNPTTTNTNSVPGTALWAWNGLFSLTENIPQQLWFGTTALNDYAGHGAEINYYVLYETEVRQGQPHMKGGLGSFAWMHNNPGNIMGPQPNYGQYSGKYGWHNFLIFPDYQTGYNAIASYLSTGLYAPLTISQAFNKYAPKKDGGNNPDLYAAEVASAAGISPLTLMRDLTPDQMALVQSKIAAIEGTVPGLIMTYDQFKSVVPGLIA